MTLLLQDMDVKVFFIWSLLQETGSLQDQPHSTLFVVHCRSCSRKKLPKSSCNEVLLARSLMTAKDYTTWLMSNPSGKANKKKVNPNRKLHIVP